VSATPIPMNWMPHLLRLPDAVFAMLLGRTMKIDPEARSSMWEDLQRGRRTEIDYLQGVIVEIAERRRLSVPLSHEKARRSSLRTRSVQTLLSPDPHQHYKCSDVSSIVLNSAELLFHGQYARGYHHVPERDVQTGASSRPHYELRLSY
jgi:hypothetical protein